MKMLMTVLISALVLFAYPDVEFDCEMLEESGESGMIVEASEFNNKSPVSQTSVLLIPDSDADVVGMYDPVDGTYLGNLIIDDPTGTSYDLQTPINAVQGPLDHIFVSDQISGAVYAFDTDGSFLYVYADGIDNVRGIDFRDDTLYITSGDDYVAMFDSPGSFAGYFIQDGTDPFDILFLADGTSLLSDIQGTSDNVRLYDADGQNPEVIFNVTFPEQVQLDVSTSGHFLNASFSDGIITEFLLDGTIIDTWSYSMGRGVYRLGNGNLLVTSSAGVQELDAVTGSIIETEYVGSCRFIELAQLPLGIEGDTPESLLPGNLFLSPNPFSARLTIGFTLAEASNVEVDIYSINGRIVRTIRPGAFDQGQHSISWDGNSDGGSPLGQGIYFVRVCTDQGIITEKVNLLR